MSSIIAKLRRLAGSAPGLIVGIGDDCAVYRPRAGEDLLFKVDPMIEDIHFRRDQSPALIGQRALARNLSDIAAMGGVPHFCLVSLSLPTQLGEPWIARFYRGLMALARRTGTALAGGHLAHAEKILCDVIVCGGVPRGKAILRSGARPGDILYVSGPLGKPWDRPVQPRLELGKNLRGRATACIDLSDGLSLDLHRLCVASGMAAKVDSVPVVRGATLERALHGGEDYELLFTLPAKASAPRGSTRIGTILRGKPGSILFQGTPLVPAGYDHFAAPIRENRKGARG